MKKICVIGDPTNKPRFSSNIITSSLNKALEELNLFDPHGLQIKYDGCCNNHGDKVHGFICSYEVSFPQVILNNAAGAPILGVSLHNWNNIIDSGYTGRSSYFSLGVDTSYYPVVEKTKNKSQFVYALYSESLARGDFDTVITAFGATFQKNKDFKLIVKDRNGTQRFKEWVDSIRDFYQVDIEYINEHWDSKEQIIDFAEKFDVYINTNRCSTWNMPVTEMMSLGKPSIITPYSGPADFCLNEFNCLTNQFEVIPVEVDMMWLKTIGCRNFFFEWGYKNTPVWAATNKDHLIQNMRKLIDNQPLMNKISKGARLTAKNLTWRKSALNLHHIANIMLSIEYYND